jgi:type I restriction enzyme S subunit
MIGLLAEKRESTVSRAVDGAEGQPARVRHAVKQITSGPRGWAAFYSDEGRLFVRIGNVSAPGIDLDLSDVVRVQPPPSKERARTEAKAGDIAVSITADVGSVAVIDDASLPCHVSQHVALLRLKDHVESRYLAYSLSASSAQAAFDAARYGGTKTQLALDDVLDIPIRLPERCVQEEVVSRLDRVADLTKTAITALSRQLDLLSEYRQALITQAVTGQLDDAMLTGNQPVDEAVGVIPE